VAADFATDAHVIEPVALCTQTSVDVNSLGAISRLREGHDSKLVEAGEALDTAQQNNTFGKRLGFVKRP